MNEILGIPLFLYPNIRVQTTDSFDLESIKRAIFDGRAPILPLTGKVRIEVGDDLHFYGPAAQALEQLLEMVHTGKPAPFAVYFNGNWYMVVDGLAGNALGAYAEETWKNVFSALRLPGHQIDYLVNRILGRIKPKYDGRERVQPVPEGQLKSNPVDGIAATISLVQDIVTVLIPSLGAEVKVAHIGKATNQIGPGPAQKLFDTVRPHLSGNRNGSHSPKVADLPSAIPIIESTDSESETEPKETMPAESKAALAEIAATPSGDALDANNPTVDDPAAEAAIQKLQDVVDGIASEAADSA